MTELLPALFRDDNLLVTLSRGLIVVAWVYALSKIWEHRTLPHANQALAGAFAMVLADLCIMFNVNIPYDVLLFFVAMSQLVLAISFTQLFGLLKKISLDDPSVQDSPLTTEVSKLYMRVLVVVTSAGVFGLALQSIVRGQ